MQKQDELEIDTNEFFSLSAMSSSRAWPEAALAGNEMLSSRKVIWRPGRRYIPFQLPKTGTNMTLDFLSCGNSYFSVAFDDNWCASWSNFVLICNAKKIIGANVSDECHFTRRRQFFSGIPWSEKLANEWQLFYIESKSIRTEFENILRRKRQCFLHRFVHCWLRCIFLFLSFRKLTAPQKC